MSKLAIFAIHCYIALDFDLEFKVNVRLLLAITLAFTFAIVYMLIGKEGRGRGGCLCI